ncbi:MAG: hypothetical protein ACYSU0_11940 [Planctomycetota bacterium]
MLFDRHGDPWELRNLAGEPEHQSVVSDMLAQLVHEPARAEAPAHTKWTGA